MDGLMNVVGYGWIWMVGWMDGYGYIDGFINYRCGPPNDEKWER